MSRLRIAIQKSGRLADKSLRLLQRCGMDFARSKDKLFWFGRDFPLDLLLVRNDDIPRMLLDGVCDLGIVGENVALEVMLERNQSEDLVLLKKLGYGQCHLAVAVPEASKVESCVELEGMRIATSYPETTKYLLAQKGVSMQISELSGSVEIAPSLGTADAIADLVSTGTTLRANHLRELEVLLSSEAALYRPERSLEEAKETILAQFLARIEGVLQAARSKYVMLHAPRATLAEITALLPGVENPSLMPLEGDPERVAIHAVCSEGVFWEHLESLKAAGASAILVLPVEKMLT